MKQLGLFSDTTLPSPARHAVVRPPERLPNLDADRRIAERLSPRILLGPSTWTFPGWEGIVYPSPIDKEELVDRGLVHIARHPLFRTVGVDRSYYAPLADAELAHYAAQLPPGFPCVMKVWSAITTYVDLDAGARNPSFLDVERCERDVLVPLARSFADHVGALVFQLAPIPSRDLPHPEAFAERLDRFFGSLSTAFRYAVELRNRELFTRPYLDALARHGIAHVPSLWERMPTVGRQIAMPGALTAPFVVCRLSISPGNRYDERRRQFAPFNRIVITDEEMRRDVASLAEICEASGRTLFVIVNNKVEGSSPLTIRALAERITSASRAGT